jgi:Calcineurin-like phosphoesterase
MTTPGPATGPAYTVTVCLESPTVGSTLTGTTEVTASATVNPAGAAAVDRMNFWWGPGTSPTYLLADHDAPYRMVLDTTEFPNSSNLLRTRAVMVGGFAPNRVGGTVTISNPTPPPDDEKFQAWVGTPPAPGERFRLATVGDGVDGSPESESVANLVRSWDPDAFAYLGDVYDTGTAPEFDTWYSDANGFGTLRSITNPTVGNHEYMASATAEPYFTFWHDIPHYYAYDIGDWHVVVLDSTVEFVNQLDPGTPQYDWLAADLAANKSMCTMAYMHHARRTNVSGVNRGGLQPVWQLLVDRGADVVLNGHAHTYEQWQPMDGAGVPTTEGLTQFVVGTGGRPILNEKGVEPRVAAEITTPGALLLELGPTDAQFTFKSSNGQFTDSGTIPCRTTPEVTPTVASTVPGDDGWDRGDVTLTWDVADPESPVTSTGCEPLTVSVDQRKTKYTCRALSGGGVTERTVTIGRDATPPILDVTTEPDAPDGANGWFVSTPTISFACDDLTSGLVGECPATVQAAEGTSTTTRSISDHAGNSTETSLETKVDLTTPTVTCDDRVTYLLHQTGTLVGAEVTDTPSGPVRPREVLAVGTGTVGDQTATVTGTDLAGRTGSDVCDYRVIYGFSGFHSPVNGSAGAVNVVKAGKVVPLKWLLADATGVPVTTLGSVRVSTVSHSCTTTAGEVQDPVEEIAPGGSGLQNFGDGSYQYNWRTPASYAGSCRTVRLDLGDDLLRTVEFRFTA